MTTKAQADAVSRLVRESVQAVDAIAPSALHALLPALQQARAELRKDLAMWLDSAPGAEDRFTAYQRAQALRALEATFDRIGDLEPAMAQALKIGRATAGPLAIKNLDHEIQRLSAVFGGGVPTIPNIQTAALIAKGDRLLWKRHEASAARYAGSIGDDIKHQFAVGLAKGETFGQMTRRLAGNNAFRKAVSDSDPHAAAAMISDGMFHKWRHWGDRLVRTENMHAYNVQHDAAIVHVNKNRGDDEDEYLRKWDASADVVTCPRCKELHGTTTTIEGAFKWGVKAPPLHPYCRCVVLAWLARWGGEKGEQGAKYDDGEAMPVQRENDAQRAKKVSNAKAAAAEDLSAFNAHTVKEKAWAEKVSIAKAKQAKTAAEFKTKLAQEKLDKQASLDAAEKAKADAAAKVIADAKRKAEHEAKLLAEKLAAEAAQAKALAHAEASKALAKLVAEKAAKEAAELAAAEKAKAAKEQKAIAAKINKANKLAAQVAPFDPDTSGTIGYIPAGKKKGKEKLLAKPGMIQVDQNTIAGHGYIVKWDADGGHWATQTGPMQQGYAYNHSTEKWHKPTIATAPKEAPLGPMPDPIKGFEWKRIGNKWVLHQGNTPTSKLVPEWKYNTSPTLADSYALGGDLAKHGMVPTGLGVMEGHGYKFEKHASTGQWFKTHTLGQPYKNKSTPEAVADKAQLERAALSSHPSGFVPMTRQAFDKATAADAKAITGQERSGVLAYSGSSYHNINGVPGRYNGLRNPPPSEHAKQEIKQIDKAFKNPAARMKQDAILYRGAVGMDAFDKFEPGGVFDDKGFVSTSMSTENGFYRSGDVRFHISVPKGHPAIAMGSELSNNSGEREILLPRDSKFRVLSKEKIDGRLYLHVEVMPHE